MRNAFVERLLEIARADPRVVLVTGDLGFSVLDGFRDGLPAQFLNAGVAEQNMIGVAAGLALSGKVVFAYSIGNFPTLRCLEHVRNDVCYHDANVKVVSVGGGFAYGAMGATHHAVEDLAVMRALPGLVVVAPGDPWEARAATDALVAHPGPAYLRLGKAGEPRVHPGPVALEIGRALTLREGLDLTLVSTGGILDTAMRAAELLERRGLRARVLSMHTLKPLDEGAILAAARETGGVLTLEEHSVIGGLGSAVAELLAEAPGARVPFRRLGAPSTFALRPGSQEYMRAQCGLDPESVAKAAAALLGA